MESHNGEEMKFFRLWCNNCKKSVSRLKKNSSVQLRLENVGLVIPF